MRGEVETGLTKAITAVLAATNTPIGAYEIARIIALHSARPVYPNTIYRSLNRMIELGFVLQVASGRGYLIRDQAISGRVLILLCSHCGGTSQLAGDALTGELDEFCQSATFRVNRTHLEVLGMCSLCTSSQKACPPTSSASETSLEASVTS